MVHGFMSHSYNTVELLTDRSDTNNVCSPVHKLHSSPKLKLKVSKSRQTGSVVCMVVFTYDHICHTLG